MIEQYINYLRNIKGYAENTCLSYEKDIRDFARWAKANLTDARWSMITRSEIDRYIYDMVDAGLKPATTNRRLSAIASLYNYFRREGYDIENPCKYECRRKIGSCIPNTIPTNELHIAYDRAQGVVKVMLGLLMTTGIRIQELLDMTWEDINFKTQAIKIHGKGNKQRIVYSRPEQLETLEQVYKMGHQTGTIFNQTQRETRRMIWDALKDVCHAPQLSPHAIRHTFATNLASHGANVTTLAGILGHNHLDTTQRYIDLTQADRRTICQQYTLFN